MFARGRYLLERSRWQKNVMHLLQKCRYCLTLYQSIKSTYFLLAFDLHDMDLLPVFALSSPESNVLYWSIDLKWCEIILSSSPACTAIFFIFYSIRLFHHGCFAYLHLIFVELLCSIPFSETGSLCICHFQRMSGRWTLSFFLFSHHDILQSLWQ